MIHIYLEIRHIMKMEITLWVSRYIQIKNQRHKPKFFSAGNFVIKNFFQHFNWKLCFLDSNVDVQMVVNIIKTGMGTLF